MCGWCPHVWGKEDTEQSMFWQHNQVVPFFAVFLQHRHSGPLTRWPITFRHSLTILLWWTCLDCVHQIVQLLIYHLAAYSLTTIPYFLHWSVCVEMPSSCKIQADPFQSAVEGAVLTISLRRPISPSNSTTIDGAHVSSIAALTRLYRLGRPRTTFCGKSTWFASERRMGIICGTFQQESVPKTL